MQTLALFLDAYRELNARKMFWIVLLLSGLVVGALGALGINERGLEILWFDVPSSIWNTGNIPKDAFYKSLFVGAGVELWLTFAAAILALISTAGIFPEFVSSGSIDLYLAKPIGRLRLFLTKYAAALLFVTLQVFVFSAASFLVLGIRGGMWEVGLFLAVPLVVCFFSYLYAVCVLIGLVTRSTLAALLLTILFWGALFSIHALEVTTIQWQALGRIESQKLDRQVKQIEMEIQALERAAPGAQADAARRDAQDRLTTARAERIAAGESSVSTLSRIAYWAKTFLPKTAETTALLGRWLAEAADLPPPADESAPIVVDESAPRMFGMSPEEMAASEQASRTLQSRDPTWVLGTSLAFEAVVLAVAAWIFCRRDY